MQSRPPPQTRTSSQLHLLLRLRVANSEKRTALGQPPTAQREASRRFSRDTGTATTRGNSGAARMGSPASERARMDMRGQPNADVASTASPGVPPVSSSVVTVCWRDRSAGPPRAMVGSAAGRRSWRLPPPYLWSGAEAAAENGSAFPGTGDPCRAAHSEGASPARPRAWRRPGARVHVAWTCALHAWALASRAARGAKRANHLPLQSSQIFSCVGRVLLLPQTTGLPARSLEGAPHRNTCNHTRMRHRR